MTRLFEHMGRFLATMVTVLVAAASAGVAYAEVGVERIGGADRYQTMELVAKTGFTSASTIVVATGDNYPDALAASALAGAKKCPVLLTSRDRLSPQVLPLASSLGAREAIIVGGEASVSGAVASRLTQAGIAVERVAGPDRTQTSIMVMEWLRRANSTSDTVVLASGDSFADALSIGPWCWSTATPVVLARNKTITDTAVSSIRSVQSVKRILIVGGQGAVSDDVRTKLGDAYEYVRLGGSDRYETSAQVASWCRAYGLQATSAGLATGTNFPDALAASALLGMRGQPLALAAPGHTSAASKAVQGARTLTVFGGEAALPSSVAREVAGNKATLDLADQATAQRVFAQIEEKAHDAVTASFIDDYDGDGAKEAFALVGPKHNDTQWQKPQLWFASSTGEVQHVESFVMWVTPYMPDSLTEPDVGFGRCVFADPAGSGHKLLSLSIHDRGSSSFSNLYSVKNGKPKKVAVKEEANENATEMVHVDGSRIVGYISVYPEGRGHKRDLYEYTFDPSTFTLSKGQLISKG